MYFSLVKLITGEELLTQVVKENDSELVLRDPIIVYRHLAPGGMTLIQCSSWMLFNKSGKVVLGKDKIVASVNDLRDDVIDNYKQFVMEGYKEMVEEKVRQRHGPSRDEVADQFDEQFKIDEKTTRH